jgi:cytochrome c oxidase subunit 1
MTVREARLALAHLWFAVGAFGLAAMMGVMQGQSRANTALPFRSPKLFYLSVTAHGVLMALVFTTFFIMGLGYVLCRTTLDRPLVARRLAWVSFWVTVIGTLAAAAMILLGKATVLYTFYPPLQAHPLFYIGATLLVVGSWGWGAVMLLNTRAWRREHPGAPLPLAMHGIVATVVVWYLATAGVAAEMLLLLIPWSLGFRETVDPVLARMLFWWFGHPLVYFWLLPAYVVWYTVLPRQAGGKLFSDSLGRVVFVLFILLSTPVGLHHQFLDPGISGDWKLAHTFATYAILFPSLVTAFTIVASLEIAGRMRGGTGLFGWIRRLPWDQPFFTAVALAILTFVVGGFGGMINAAFSMNAMIHNTAWVQGHFHLTVGTASALTFMGAAYWMWPRLTGKPLRLLALAKVQPYLWFVGMLIFSTVNHITGLLGMPRRVYDASYGGEPITHTWQDWTGLSALGGSILFVSAMSFVLVLVVTALGKPGETAESFEYADALEGPVTRTKWDRLALWTGVAVVLVVLAYAWPIWDLLQLERFGSRGFPVP